MITFVLPFPAAVLSGVLIVPVPQLSMGKHSEKAGSVWVCVCVCVSVCVNMSMRSTHWELRQEEEEEMGGDRKGERKPTNLTCPLSSTCPLG